MIIGTAGHIDHGKTSLVRALTGVDTDRLKEEKARGITIDLGFAYLPVEGGGILGFVDVPGHERFIHTMLAGANGIDFALLAIAADDGVMPQTIEHLAILDLLGIRQGVIALTKADLVSTARLAAVASEIRRATANSMLGTAEIVAVSVQDGRGIADLRARLESAATALVGRAGREGGFRLAVDRVFLLSGIGVVVTGTILAGRVRVGDRVTVSPSGLTARVRSLHVQDRPAEEGRAGDRCALNLAGEGIEKGTIHRGDMVLGPFLHAPTDRIDAKLRLLATEAKPVGQWFPVRLHHGSTEVGARVVLLEETPIQPGEAADVQMVLDRPIAAAATDRYVVRDVSAQRTIGGGVFLDLRPPARKRRSPERAAQRAALAIGPPVDAMVALLRAPPHAVDIAAFARDRALTEQDPARLAAATGALVFPSGNALVGMSADRWEMFGTELLAQLLTFHAEHPVLQGQSRERLRLSVRPRLERAEFLVALRRLAEEGRIVLEGAFVRAPEHSARLAPEDEAGWAEIAERIGGDERFRAPRVRDIAAETGRLEADVRRILKIAARQGRVDQVAHDHFFLRGTVREMVGIMMALGGRAPDGFIAAQFRDQIGTGRKVAIHILEFFDRHGVTMKRGDLRRLNRQRLHLFDPADAVEAK